MQLQPHTVVITPTARLAYYLQKTKAHRGRIVSVQEWLRQLWEDYLSQTPAAPTLINSWQSSVIWQRIIQQQDLPLLRPHAVVQAVQQAWQLLQQWQIPLTEIAAYLAQEMHHKNSDSELFLKWAQQYAAECENNNWVDEAVLPHFLAAHMSAVKQNFYLYGFNYVTPQLKKLCSGLQAKGAVITEHQLVTEQRAALNYFYYPDKQSEWRAAALWAKEQKQGIVGIVIPELAQQWSKVQRIFTEVLAPEQLVSGDVETAKPFNLDAGLPVTQYPLIADTLVLLQWLITPLPYAQASHLLRSVFLPHATEEFTLRAQLTVDLAKQNQHELAIFSLINYLQTDPQQSCPLLLAALALLKQEREQWPKKALPSQWVNLLKKLLLTSQWAQASLVHKREQQIWQRWESALEDIANLDVVLPEPISYGYWLKLLQQYLQPICFQPESTLANIQVMGILETSGMSFAHLWVCGLHAKTWPSAPEPNPFIPAAVQRQYALPHSSYTQELSYAQQFTQQWLCTAQQLICSYPAREGDTEFLPSPLLASEPVCADWQASANPLQKDFINSRENILEHPYGLPCESVTANARLLQDQAECPFRAYAYHRLGLAQHKLVIPQSLGNALMRGMVLHRTFQLIWGALVEQQQLLSLDIQQLNALVAKYVAQTLQEYYSQIKSINSIPDIFLEVERERLTLTILQWLDKERNRSQFRIHCLEHSVQLQLPDLTLNLRLDRVDQLENDTFIIIDYKTSKPPTMSFIAEQSERLGHTQLPLYALSKPEALAAVVFAQVAGEQVGFSGWIDETCIDDLPKKTHKALLSTNFSQQLEEWQQQLTSLAQEYLAGYAKVDPYPDQNVCRNCDLQLLCKVSH